MPDQTDVEWIDPQQLDELSRRAGQSGRKRINLNFHRSDHAACHRLLNAMEPDSYIQPHRHLEPEKDETLVVIRGEMGLVWFDEQGTIAGTLPLGRPGGATIVTVPAGRFHTWACLQPGSVFFEAKAGPYRPLTGEERAPWAPGEGDPDAAGYLERLRRLFLR